MCYTISFSSIIPWSTRMVQKSVVPSKHLLLPLQQGHIPFCIVAGRATCSNIIWQISDRIIYPINTIQQHSFALMPNAAPLHSNLLWCVRLSAAVPAVSLDQLDKLLL